MRTHPRWNITAVELESGGHARKALGAGRVEPQTLVDDGLQVGQLLGFLRSDRLVRGERAADLFLEPAQGIRMLQQERRRSREEGRDGFASRNAVRIVVPVSNRFPRPQSSEVNVTESPLRQCGNMRRHLFLVDSALPDSIHEQADEVLARIVMLQDPANLKSIRALMAVY